MGCMSSSTRYGDVSAVAPSSLAFYGAGSKAVGNEGRDAWVLGPDQIHVAPQVPAGYVIIGKLDPEAPPVSVPPTLPSRTKQMDRQTVLCPTSWAGAQAIQGLTRTNSKQELDEHGGLRMTVSL
eukprot:TRINITY_DN48449_c0_g1_i1.p1 TRINITY_DN48449_c0_g1~~TRINITY_DN48449_c0_g1_i1.p1  ORF type:complete len:124 (+),score=17.92 TRINITY_DN48449_c0_g1_i1:122-493(+)